MNERAQEDVSMSGFNPAALPRDLALIKMENESIMSMATMPNNRRDHKAIRAEIIEQLEAYPAFARTAVYSKPVGTVTVVYCRCGAAYEEAGSSIGQCPKCDKVDVKSSRRRQKFAQGLSIRAAEAISEVYGYNRIRVDVTEIDDDKVRIEATFVDLQKGRSYSDSGILSKLYRARDGKMARTPDDRFYNITVKAEASKRVREVIMRCVPPGLRAELQDVALQRMKEALNGVTIERIIETFAEFRLGREDLERIVGKTVGAGWTEEDRAELVQVYNSLKTGECTTAELLAGLDDHGTTDEAGKKEKLKSDVNELLDRPKTTPTQPAKVTAPVTEPVTELPTTAAREEQPTPPKPAAKPANKPAPAATGQPPKTRTIPSVEAHGELADCKTVADADKCERKFSPACKTPDEFDAWATACDDRRTAIREAYKATADAAMAAG